MATVPTGVEILRKMSIAWVRCNISTPVGTVAIHWFPGKILRYIRQTDDRQTDERWHCYMEQYWVRIFSGTKNYHCCVVIVVIMASKLQINVILAITYNWTQAVNQYIWKSILFLFTAVYIYGENTTSTFYFERRCGNADKMRTWLQSTSLQIWNPCDKTTLKA